MFPGLWTKVRIALLPCTPGLCRCCSAQKLAEQVTIVSAGLRGLIDDVPVDKVVDFSRELHEYLKSNKAEFITEI